MANWARHIRETAGLPVHKRARGSIHLQRPDGKTVAYFSGVPCHYETSPGEWAEIDTALRDIGDGVLSGLGTPAEIHPDGTTRVKNKNHRQRAARVVRYRPSTGDVSSIATIPTGGTVDDASFVRDGGSWAYTVTITETGARAELLLRTKPSFPGNTQPTDYICIEEIVEGATFPDGEIETDFEIEGLFFPVPTATDASGDVPDTRRWALNAGGVQYVYTGVPAGWLDTATYPVVVDPDFVGGTTNGYVTGTEVDYARARLDSTAHYSNFSIGLVGQEYLQIDDLYNIFRCFSAFDTSSIGSGQNIENVNLQVTAQGRTGSGAIVEIVKQDWSGQAPIDSSNRETAYDNCLAGTADNGDLGSIANFTFEAVITSGDLDTSWVNKTGTTYYSFRTDRDAIGTIPSGGEYVVMYSGSSSTESYRPVLIVVYTRQRSYPTSDVSAGSWTASSGSDLYAMIDEETASDTDYILSATDPSADIAVVALSTVTDPEDHTNHTVRYRYRKENVVGTGQTVNLTVRLKQGTTTIASWVHSNVGVSWLTADNTLSEAEAANITDYTALRLEFEADAP